MPSHGYRVAPVAMRDVDEIFPPPSPSAPCPHVARLAAGKVNKAQLERLEKACRVKMPLDVGNQIDFFLEANRAFHMAIAVAGGNQRLCRTLGGLLGEMTRLVALGFGVQGIQPNIEDYHRQMINYLAAGCRPRSQCRGSGRESWQRLQFAGYSRAASCR
jgi:DNA-binding GntR family transcriptional regulator